MSRLARPLVLLLACLLLVFLALGWRGLQRQEDLRAHLAGQATIALQLKTLHEAAQSLSGGALLSALDQSLEQLAPAARDTTEIPSAAPLPQQLEISTDALIEFGLTTDSIDDRARALTAATRIWSAARAEGITDQKYPAALTQKLTELASFSCPQSQAESPAPSHPLSQMQAALYQLNYVSEVYSARAGNGYAAIKDRAQNLAQQTAILRDTALPVLICAQRLETAQPSYPTVGPEQASSQLTDLSSALVDYSFTVFADPALAPAEDHLEVITLAVALHPVS